MKKILFLILVTLISGFIFYHFFLNKKNRIDPIKLVPASAIIVHEVIDPIDKWKKLRLIYDVNDSIYFIDELSHTFEFIDTLLEGKIEKLSRNNKLVSSFHLISKSEFDLLFFLDISLIDKEYFIEKLIGNKYSLQKRNFNGFQIFNVISNNKTFSFFLYKNLFIGSHSAILIEDVVRVINNPKITFYHLQFKLFDFIKIKKDFGDIYVNSDKIKDLLEIFIDEEMFKVDELNEYIDGTFLDFSISNSKILLNGFSLNYSKNKLSSSFTNNLSDAYSINNLIPNNTLWINHLSLDTPKNIINISKKILLEKKENYKANSNLNEELSENIDKEFALLTLERSLKNRENKLLIIKSKDTSVFNKLIEKSNINNKKLLAEKYVNKIIKETGIKNFPFHLFGHSANKFNNSFYIFINNYIIISNSVENIRDYIDKLDEEETWSKSLFFSEITDKLNKESNLSLVINVPKTLIFFQPKIRKNYRKNFINFLEKFDVLSIQLTKIDEKIYTSIIFNKSRSENKDVYSNRNFKPNYELDFSEKIITKPYLIRNHVNNSVEVVIQNKLNFIHQISSKLKKIWSDSISSKISSKIYQIDYYKNNKKQIIFSTENEIHAYDRNGDYLAEYPLKNPSKNKINHFNIIDYDQSKQYRLALADIKGNIYLLDKTGKILEGWNPLVIENALSEPPFHLRIAGRDYIILIEKEGKINVLNRKGKNYKGFPLIFDSKIRNSTFVQKNSNYNNTTISLLLDNGKFLEFNLQGQILKENQIYRPSVNSRFYLLTDPSKRNYKIIIQDNTSVYILENENVQFKKEFLNAKNLNFQYYYFGGDHEIIVILDKNTKSIFLYDSKGKLISEKEIFSDQLISILYYQDSKEYKIYSILNNKLSIISLKN